jgi:F-type H+-transporting ATPase subunit gamma
MTGQRGIRQRIRGVERISHITRAMKTVSAIRLMRVQNQVLKQKPYAAKLRDLVEDLVARTSEKAHPMLRSDPFTTKTPTEVDSIQYAAYRGADGKSGRMAVSGRRIAVIALGSDRGLCGPFNNNLVTEIERFLDAHREHDVRLIVFGKKLLGLLRTRKIKTAQEYVGFYPGMTFDRVAQLGVGFLDDYMRAELDELIAIYTEFRTSTRQKVRQEYLLPIGMVPSSSGMGTPPVFGAKTGSVPGIENQEPRTKNQESGAGEPLFPPYTYEPNPYAVLDQVLPMYYKRELWRVFLESVASEHMARMLAMDMATVNAGEMIQELTLSYNKVRQEAITRELSDISGATEAFRQ